VEDRLERWASSVYSADGSNICIYKYSRHIHMSWRYIAYISIRQQRTQRCHWYTQSKTMYAAYPWYVSKLITVKQKLLKTWQSTDRCRLLTQQQQNCITISASFGRILFSPPFVCLSLNGIIHKVIYTFISPKVAQNTIN